MVGRHASLTICMSALHVGNAFDHNFRGIEEIERKWKKMGNFLERKYIDRKYLWLLSATWWQCWIILHPLMVSILHCLKSRDPFNGNRKIPLGPIFPSKTMVFFQFIGLLEIPINFPHKYFSLSIGASTIPPIRILKAPRERGNTIMCVSHPINTIQWGIVQQDYSLFTKTNGLIILYSLSPFQFNPMEREHSILFSTTTCSLLLRDWLTTNCLSVITPNYGEVQLCKCLFFSISTSLIRLIKHLLRSHLCDVVIRKGTIRIKSTSPSSKNSWFG